MRYDQLYVVALVVDKNKKIVNAAKMKVGQSDADGIRAEKTVTATAEAYYTVDGKCLAAPAKGMNVVRMSDGTTRKVLK